jgi:hypothetical protein
VTPKKCDSRKEPYPDISRVARDECHILLSHLPVFHGFLWPHMELPTRKKLFQEGSGHVDTVGGQRFEPSIAHHFSRVSRRFNLHCN